MKIKLLKKWFSLGCFLAMLFWAVKTLFGPGFFQNHDGAFHLIRLWQFDKVLKTGIFPVRWASDLNNGFGSPLFIFFYPLPYYLAEIFHLTGFSLGSSLKIVVILSLGLSWGAMFLWLKERLGQLAAFLGATFYLYAPYRFLTAYVAFTIGEVVGFIFPPLILWLWLKFNQTKRKKYFVLTSFTLGLLILSHNIFAMIFLPIVLIYLWLNIDKKKLVLACLALGLGVSAYFWLPALLEKQYVKLGHQPAAPYQDHFLIVKQLVYSPWGYGYSVLGSGDGMSFQIGLAQLAVFGLCLLGLVFKWKIKWEKEKTILIFLGIFSTAVFLMIEPSRFIWENLSLLAQLQYPWRLLSVCVFISAFLAGWLIKKTDSKLLFAILLGLVLVANRNHLRTFDRLRHEDSFYLENHSLAYGSTDISSETLPIWASDPADLPAQTVDQKIELLGKGEIVNQNLKPQIYLADLNLETDQRVRVNTFYFPGWHVFIDNQAVTIDYKPNGFIEFEAPTGNHELRVVFKNTLTRTLANGISLLSLFICLFLFLREIRQYNKTQTKFS